MSLKTFLRRQLRVERHFVVQFVSIVVAAHGVFILATTLLEQLDIRREARETSVVIDLPLLIGVSLLYLSSLLRRRKRTAWAVTALAYSFYLGVGVAGLVMNVGFHDLTGLQLVKAVLLPLAILGLLLVVREEFVVRSDAQGFRSATRFALAMLAVALVYGVTGFTLLDKTDFHQEIAVPTAVHYTIDRFDLTTNRPLHAYTKRGRLFVDSLTFVSVAAVAYVAVSLFQPLRLRLSDQAGNRDHLQELLKRYDGTSEDFFKLWPHDKQYFFSPSGRSGLAFHVYHGVALCLGDPVGDKREFKGLLDDFQSLCFGNDWLPAFIHVSTAQRRLYQNHGFVLQKIGQEALLDLEQFHTTTGHDKYFRHIRNKFTKQGFTCELLTPPHHTAVVERLSTISREWLQSGGRVERGFAMGYFTPEYMQLCSIMVARDAAGTIQAFINQLPTEYAPTEANFDLLRHTKGSLGNINDFLLMNFIDNLQERGYRQLNLGLCPLSGLEGSDSDQKGVIDSVLRFAYANGDRFYSFSGLYRFKAKYEPEWRDRYIAYQGGVRGFTRTTNALMRAMRLKRQLKLGSTGK